MRRLPPASADDLLIKIIAVLLILFAGLLAYRVLWSQAEAGTRPAPPQAAVRQPTPEDVTGKIRRIALEAQLQSLRGQRPAPQPQQQALPAVPTVQHHQPPRGLERDSAR